MIDKPHFFPIVMCLLLWIGVAVAQNDTGGISQPAPGGVTQPGQKDDTPPTSPSDAKPLPWKFLAKPMGVLDEKQWMPLLKSLDCDDPAKCKIPDGELTNLFHATFGQRALPRTTPIYVVLHVVKHGDSATDTSGTKSTPDGTTNNITDQWYLYRSVKGHFGEPKWTYARFTGQRIYGAKTVLFLFLHPNNRVITVDHAVSQLNQLIHVANGDIDDKTIKEELDNRNLTALLRQQTKANAELLQTQIVSGFLKNGGTKVSFCEATTDDEFTWSNGGGISNTAGRVRYEAAVVKRTPANIANLKLILGLLLGKAEAKKQCVPLVANDILWGAGRIDNMGLPSDITIAGYSVKNNEDVDKPVQEADRSKLQLGTTGSYNNEQLYWWDASIGIPVHSIKDLQYSDTDNTVTATQVDKQSAYAMFNLMLIPVDLSNSGDNLKPRLLFGFPLASDPWDKLFAGGAIGLPGKPFRNFQFFAGATFLRTSSPSTLTAGDTATTAQLLNNLRIQMTPKFTFGINVPVKSVIDKLK